MMHDQNQWFAVRCCCSPQKVFGFLKLPAPNNPRTTHQRTLTDKDGRPHPVKIMPIYVNKAVSVLPFDDPNALSVMLGRTAPELAIYSDDRPVEFWRTIPGFVEAPATEES